MVHFLGCKEDDYSANIIAVNMIAQCNHYGNQYLLLDSIFGHKEDDSAIKWGNKCFDLKGKSQF